MPYLTSSYAAIDGIHVRIATYIYESSPLKGIAKVKNSSDYAIPDEFMHSTIT